MLQILLKGLLTIRGFEELEELGWKGLGFCYNIRMRVFKKKKSKKENRKWAAAIGGLFLFFLLRFWI